MIFDPETMKIHICKRCKGLGFGLDLKGNHFICSECGGTGRILVRTIKDEFTLGQIGDDLPFDKDTMNVRICKSCSGIGYVSFGDESRECKDCHGTGRIIEQKVQNEYQLHHLDGFKEE